MTRSRSGNPQLGVRLLVLMLAASTALSGCSATIRRHGLRDVDGVIHSSDPFGVNVHTGHGLYRVPGEQIADIDHPGNGVMIGGGVAFVFSAMLMALTVSDIGSSSSIGSTQGMSLTYLVIGAALAISGGLPWAFSKSAAAAFEERTPREEELIPIDSPPPGAIEVDR